MDEKRLGSSLGAAPGLAGKSPPLLRGTDLTSLGEGAGLLGVYQRRRSGMKREFLNANRLNVKTRLRIAQHS